MTGVDVQFLNTRVGATPATSATHGHSCGCGTAGNTANPDCPCLGVTATHGHGRPLLRQ